MGVVRVKSHLHLELRTVLAASGAKRLVRPTSSAFGFIWVLKPRAVWVWLTKQFIQQSFFIDVGSKLGGDLPSFFVFTASARILD